jgi:hypothetical protein
MPIRLLCLWCRSRAAFQCIQLPILQIELELLGREGYASRHDDRVVSCNGISKALALLRVPRSRFCSWCGLLGMHTSQTHEPHDYLVFVLRDLINRAPGCLARHAPSKC